MPIGILCVLNLTTSMYDKTSLIHLILKPPYCGYVKELYFSAFEFWIPGYLFEERLICLVKSKYDILQYLTMHLFAVFVILPSQIQQLLLVPEINVPVLVSLPKGVVIQMSASFKGAL